MLADCVELETTAGGETLRYHASLSRNTHLPGAPPPQLLRGAKVRDRSSPRRRLFRPVLAGFSSVGARPMALEDEFVGFYD